MHLVQLLLPLRDNARRPFPRSHYDRVYQELTDRFGGATAFIQAPASGAWKEPATSHSMREELVLFEVMCTLDPRWWGEYRRELEQRYAQDSMVVRALEMLRL